MTLALSGELATRPQQGGATVVLRASDIDSVERHSPRRRAAGAVEDMGGARMLEFFDPDGNEIVAIQPDSPAPQPGRVPRAAAGRHRATRR